MVLFPKIFKFCIISGQIQSIKITLSFFSLPFTSQVLFQSRCYHKKIPTTEICKGDYFKIKLNLENTQELLQTDETRKKNFLFIFEIIDFFLLGKKVK